MNHRHIHKYIQSLADLVRLFCALPKTGHIFLRREFDRFYRFLLPLATAYRRLVLRRTRIIAVVGSLGKTTTQRALNAVLSCPERNFSFSNYGSSLAANVLRVRWRDAHAVLEVGIAGPGRMDPYAKMINPDIVVVTSIKSEHNRSFPSLLDTREEKVKMVRKLSSKGLVVLNGDDPNVLWMATQTCARVVTVGINPDNDIRAEKLKNYPEGMSFAAILPGGSFKVQTRFFGFHMIYPFLAAIAVAYMEGTEPDQAISRLAKLETRESRMEVIRLTNNITIIDDSFKGTIETVHGALEMLASLSASRKIVVFGGIEEPPGKQGALNREIGRRLGYIADEVICLGRSLSGVSAGAVENGLKREAVHFIGPDFRAVVSWLKRELCPGDLLLIKGKSTQRLRRIVLDLSDRKVSCAVPYCKVKVRACDFCPLIDAESKMFRNHYISRYVRE